MGHQGAAQIAGIEVPTCNAVSFSRDRKSIASGHRTGKFVTTPEGRLTGQIGQLRLWRAVDLRLQLSLPITFPVTAVRFGRQDRKVALGAGDGSVYVVDVEQSSLPQTQSAPAPNAPVSSLVFVREGRWLAAGNLDHRTRVSDVESGKLLFTLHENIDGGCVDRVLTMCYREGKGVLVTGSWDGVVRYWDVAKGKLVGKRTLFSGAPLM